MKSITCWTISNLALRRQWFLAMIALWNFNSNSLSGSRNQPIFLLDDRKWRQSIINRAAWVGRSIWIAWRMVIFFRSACGMLSWISMLVELQPASKFRLKFRFCAHASFVWWWMNKWSAGEAMKCKEEPLVLCYVIICPFRKNRHSSQSRKRKFLRNMWTVSDKLLPYMTRAATLVKIA